MIVVDLRLGSVREASLVIECAGQLAWKIDVIVDNYFQMNLSQFSVGEKDHQRRLILVELILRDVRVMDHLCDTQLFDDLRL